MTRFLIRFTLIALIFWGPAAAHGQDSGLAPLELLYGFTLIDGRGGPPIPDAAIAIRGNEILAVSSRRALLSGPNAPRDAIVTNLGGGYVIPGLIDAHVHLATSPNRERAEAELNKLLHGGVTAVRDMAGDTRTLASLARDSRLGQLNGPDVYFAALVAGPSFFSDPRPQSSAAGEIAGEVPWMQAITPDTDLVTAVARAKGTYASGMKIYANLEASEVTRLTAEAHRQKMRVWAHSMVFPARPLEVVRAGVDVVSHVCRLAWEGMAEAPLEYHHDRVPRYRSFDADSRVFTELFEAMRQEGTILDATLAMYARAEENPANPLSDRCDVDFARSLVRRAYEAGIPIAAGTDFTTPDDDPFPALFLEIEELVHGAGLSPMAAIEAATRVAASAIGVGDTHGVLEYGRPVSFVLLEENPLDDIGNLRTVKAVWKNAERFDRVSYRARVAEAASARRTANRGPSTPREALDGWLRLWRNYDLDHVGDVFLRDSTVTYFASDVEGAMEGYASVLAYHVDAGFVPGGFRPDHDIWLDDVVLSDYGESAVVSGVWRFGNRLAEEHSAHGPFTMMLVRTENGYRISHLNMANYPRDD